MVLIPLEGPSEITTALQLLQYVDGSQSKTNTCTCHSAFSWLSGKVFLDWTSNWTLSFLHRFKRGAWLRIRQDCYVLLCSQVGQHLANRRKQNRGGEWRPADDRRALLPSRRWSVWHLLPSLEGWMRWSKWLLRPLGDQRLQVDLMKPNHVNNVMFSISLRDLTAILPEVRVMTLAVAAFMAAIWEDTFCLFVSRVVCFHFNEA